MAARDDNPAPAPPVPAPRGRLTAPVVRRRSVDTDGVLWLEADVSDDTGLLGSVRVRLTEGRALLVEWTGAAGAPPLTGFQAWERVV